MPVYPARHIGISIDLPVEEVYAFLADPLNFPKWAEGLGQGFKHLEGMTWLVETPMGLMRVMFSEPNRHGVLDHALIPASGEAIHNPMRIFANGSGSEVVFTLYRRDGMTEDDFARDADWVMSDLRRLKTLLEG